MLNRIINEVIVWIRKYFIMLDEVIGELDSTIRGRNEIRLISRPIQIIRKELLDIATRIPQVSLDKNKVLE
jgi:hypothetical protein